MVVLEEMAGRSAEVGSRFLSRSRLCPLPPLLLLRAARSWQSRAKRKGHAGTDIVSRDRGRRDLARHLALQRKHNTSREGGSRRDVCHGLTRASSCHRTLPKKLSSGACRGHRSDVAKEEQQTRQRGAKCSMGGNLAQGGTLDCSCTNQGRTEIAHAPPGKRTHPLPCRGSVK